VAGLTRSPPHWFPERNEKYVNVKASMKYASTTICHLFRTLSSSSSFGGMYNVESVNLHYCRTEAVSKCRYDRLVVAHNFSFISHLRVAHQLTNASSLCHYSANQKADPDLFQTFHFTVRVELSRDEVHYAPLPW